MLNMESGITEDSMFSMPIKEAIGYFKIMV